jgi:hypothetical protein
MATKAKVRKPAGTRKAAPATRRPKADSKAGVSVRMYCHGLGDCFLLRFPNRTGKGSTNVLIDCGVIGVAKDPKPLMERVVGDIKDACGGRLDLVLVTHEHWDHVSGFSTQQAQRVFDNIEIGAVWYAWTEDPSPSNNLGQKLRRERAAKAQAVQLAAVAMGQMQEPFAVERTQRIQSLLSFFGYDGTQQVAVPLATDGGTIGKTRAAFDYLAKRRGVKVRYCRPGDAPVDLPAAKTVRTYVLGPPEDEGLIKRSSPTKKGAEVYEFSGELMMDEQIGQAFERLSGVGSSEQTDCPFDPSYQCNSVGGTVGSADLQSLMQKAWNTEPWRQIPQDWTAIAETLALNLDKHTNNTGLVVAFELVDSGNVLLFAADAQVGNWLSWQDVHWRLPSSEGSKRVSGPDLLARTVFYKVGHHGSHNATLRALGLEQMTSDGLVAFIPVNKEQAEKNRWHEMPFEPLVKRLAEKTGGRLVMSDPKTPPPDEAALAALSASDRKTFLKNLKPGPGTPPLYWEYTIPA